MKKETDMGGGNNKGGSGCLTMPVMAAGAWILYSKFFVNHEHVLPDAIEAKRVVFRSKLGANLNYYVDRQVSRTAVGADPRH